MDKDCVFCRIGRFEDVPSGKVITDLPSFYIMEPLYPVAEGHVLVVPRRHVTDAAQDPNLTADVMKIVANHIKGIGPCNIIISVGEEASQIVMHLYVHIVPRHEGDGLKLPWTA